MTKHSSSSEGLPSSSDCNQSRSYPVNPKTTFGETEIDPNQQRSVRNLLRPQTADESLSTGKE